MGQANAFDIRIKDTINSKQFQEQKPPQSSCTIFIILKLKTVFPNIFFILSQNLCVFLKHT